MTEAIFGFIGVIVGALASAGTTFWITRWSASRHAQEESDDRVRVLVAECLETFHYFSSGYEKLCDTILKSPPGEGTSETRLEIQVSHDEFNARENRLVTNLYRLGDQSSLDFGKEMSNQIHGLEPGVNILENLRRDPLPLSMYDPVIDLLWRLFELSHHPERLINVFGPSQVPSSAKRNISRTAAHSPDTRPDRSDREGGDA